MKTFEAVSPMDGSVARVVTDQGSITYERPPGVAQGETVRFDHECQWAVAMLAPLVEPKAGQRTLYSLRLKEVVR